MTRPVHISTQRELPNLVKEAQAQRKMGRRRQNKIIYSNCLLWERNHSTYIIPDIQLSRIFPKLSSEGIPAAFLGNWLQHSTVPTVSRNVLFESSFLEAGTTQELSASPISTSEKVVCDINEICRKNSGPKASDLLCIACNTTLWEHFCGYVNIFGNN